MRTDFCDGGCCVLPAHGAIIRAAGVRCDGNVRESVYDFGDLPTRRSLGPIFCSSERERSSALARVDERDPTACSRETLEEETLDQESEDQAARRSRRRDRHRRRHRLRRAWMPSRAALQLVGLLVAGDEGLHLAAQALVVVGDLAVNALDKRTRR